MLLWYVVSQYTPDRAVLFTNDDATEQEVETTAARAMMVRNVEAVVRLTLTPEQVELLEEHVRQDSAHVS